MPNIAAILKQEICRLAKKEVKAYTNTTKQAVAKYRTDIAELKREVQNQRKQLARVAASAQGHEQASAEEDPLGGARYSSRSVRAQRQRLGLSAECYGRLVGVSGLTIYNWEHDKARPRKAQLAALIAIRGIGKREASQRLEDLEQQAKGQRRGRKKARR